MRSTPPGIRTYAEELRRSFGLDPSARIKNLSKGQKARAGLLVALAHRPELLLLDEPSSGLDPVVRRDILEAIMRTIADEGRTVLFSSHLLDEVERVADHVTMINHGRIVLSGPLDTIKHAHRGASLDEIFAANAGMRLTTEPVMRSPAARAFAWEFGRQHRWGVRLLASLRALHAHHGGARH